MKYFSANDNQPAKSKATGQPVPERMPAERAEARSRVRAKVKAEGKTLASLKRSLARRNKPSDGWDGKPDNDNVSLPIIKALLAEGNNDLLPALLLYRRVEAGRNNGNLLPFVENVSKQTVSTASPRIVAAANQQVVPTMAKYQGQKAGGDYRNQ